MCRAMQENYDEGFAEGFEEGFAEGIAEGIAETREMCAVRALKMNDFSVEKIAELTRLPIDRVIELKTALEKEG